jgi:predicted nucleotidyltransferase
MAMTLLPPDFKDFLKLLNSRKVKYLLIGGYAVAYHGYSRATADMDLWIAIDPENARNLVEILSEFGFAAETLEPGLFLQEGKIVRMGVPPLRIEILTTISGVTFTECFHDRVLGEIDGVDVPIISLEHLKANKKASGRFKDLSDLEHLE